MQLQGHIHSTAPLPPLTGGGDSTIRATLALTTLNNRLASVAISAANYENTRVRDPQSLARVGLRGPQSLPREGLIEPYFRATESLRESS
jgi:hypothetical protein